MQIEGTMYGAIVKIKGDATPEKIAEAKKALVDKVCAMIREIADNNDDFFIIHDSKDFPMPTESFVSVGHKLFLPTVKEGKPTDIPVSTYLD